jgi:hypothetical protein
MMRFAIVDLRHRGLAPEQIYLSMERNMRCAIGLCGHVDALARVQGEGALDVRTAGDRVTEVRLDIYGRHAAPPR